MSKVVFIDVFSLIKIWAVGFFGFDISGLIHLLPAVAIIVILLSFLFAKTFSRQSIRIKPKPVIIT